MSAAPYLLALAIAVLQIVCANVFGRLKVGIGGRIALDFTCAFLFPSVFVAVSALVFGNGTERGPLVFYAVLLIVAAAGTGIVKSKRPDSSGRRK